MISKNYNKRATICFLDSGIGGLNILRACANKIQGVDFFYLSDNQNVPYGSRSNDELFLIAKQKFTKMKNLNCDAAVIACNTLTATCIDRLRKEFSFPIIGIQPAIKQAMEKNGECLVLLTPSTANSSSFYKLFNLYGNERMHVCPMPSLASYIEENIFEIDEQIIISMLPTLNADNVVLGCTHYIFVKNIIKKYYKCNIFDGSIGIVNHLISILGIFDHNVHKNSKIVFYDGDICKNKQVFESFTK